MKRSPTDTIAILLSKRTKPDVEEDSKAALRRKKQRLLLKLGIAGGATALGAAKTYLAYKNYKHPKDKD